MAEKINKAKTSRATRKSPRVRQVKKTTASPVGDVDREVQFEYFAPDSREVAVAGSFNDWNPDAGRLEKGEDGNWRRGFQLRPGRYEYRMVVDGNWVTDEKSPEREWNPYGSENSVLEVRA